eukprot:gnl/MRDRNA2_/MRDRNA2_109277_c0_seq1.p1 gnl/MRDRNA2_/MRDRNA2_109277_c0~~gnl/MRDRNA2_/MRDRNA2_109277_c0_seq1.p1  ORF type:complete len:258 (+),score=42.04 gnl/MRDRNA2_/MRDRNA2_109277_c0_seq1:99-776(+)
METYVAEIRRRAVCHALEDHGFSHAQEAALDLAGNEVVRFIESVGAAAQGLAEYAGRSRANHVDVCQALLRVGPEKRTMASIVQEVEECPAASGTREYHAFPKPAPIILDDAEHDILDVPLDGRRTQDFKMPAHIPAFMPKFPPAYMYKSAPQRQKSGTSASDNGSSGGLLLNLLKGPDEERKAVAAALDELTRHDTREVDDSSDPRVKRPRITTEEEPKAAMNE